MGTGKEFVRILLLEIFLFKVAFTSNPEKEMPVKFKYLNEFEVQFSGNDP
jgi:hypothetical protein